MKPEYFRACAIVLGVACLLWLAYEIGNINGQVEGIRWAKQHLCGGASR